MRHLREILRLRYERKLAGRRDQDHIGVVTMVGGRTDYDSRPLLDGG